MKYKVHFMINTDGFIELEAITEEEARDAVEAILASAVIEIPPQQDDIAVTSYEPEITFQEIYEAE